MTTQALVLGALSVPQVDVGARARMYASSTEVHVALGSREQREELTLPLAAERGGLGQFGTAGHAILMPAFVGARFASDVVELRSRRFLGSLRVKGVLEEVCGLPEGFAFGPETGAFGFAQVAPAPPSLPYGSLIRTLLEKEQVGAARKLLSIALRDAPPELDLWTLAKVLAPARVSAVAKTDVDRTREYRWLKAHGPAYPGQWVALDGDRLLAHSDSLKELLSEVKRLRLEQPPLVHRVE